MRHREWPPKCKLPDEVLVRSYRGAINPDIAVRVPELSNTSGKRLRRSAGRGQCAKRESIQSSCRPRGRAVVVGVQPLGCNDADYVVRCGKHPTKNKIPATGRCCDSGNADRVLGAAAPCIQVKTTRRAVAHAVIIVRGSGVAQRPE